MLTPFKMLYFQIEVYNTQKHPVSSYAQVHGVTVAYAGTTGPRGALVHRVL